MSFDPSGRFEYFGSSNLTGESGRDVQRTTDLVGAIQRREPVWVCGASKSGRGRNDQVPARPTHRGNAATMQRKTIVPAGIVVSYKSIGCSTSALARATAWGHALAKIAAEPCVRAVLAADPALRMTEDPLDIPWRQVSSRSPARLVVSSGRVA